VKKTNTIILLVLTTILCRCTFAPTAGGTTDTGNARVAATIYTSDGDPAAGVTVTVCPSEYYSDISPDSTDSRQLYVRVYLTDDSGHVSIDSIDSGDYTIEANDGESGAVLLNISLSEDEDSSLTLEGTLLPFATVQGSIETHDEPTLSRYVVIYGTDRRISVEEDGTFTIDNIPGGTFHLLIVSDDESWETVEFDSVTVAPGSLATITNISPLPGAKIFLNTSPDGADVSEDVYDFPILVRLGGNNFNFDEAENGDSGFRCMKADSTPLPFEFEVWNSDAESALLWVLVDTVYGGNDAQFFILQWGNKTDTSGEQNVFQADNGFLATYHLGGTLEDASTNDFDGIDSGTVDTSGGIIGRARFFNGSSQFFSIDSLPERESGSISFWFRLIEPFSSSTSPAQGIWGSYVSDNTNCNISLMGTQYYSGLDRTHWGSVITKLEKDATGYYLSTTTNAYDADTWYHLVWTWGNGNDSIYLNGSLEATTPTTIGIPQSAKEEIGRTSYDTDNISSGGPLYFGGTLDEFRIDNTIRNPHWIRLSYMNQREEGGLVTVVQNGEDAP
jgi:hypothetical protein